MPPTSIPSTTTGPFPVRPGNRVRAHVDGVAAFGRIHDAVQAATRSVWVTVAFVSHEFRFPGTDRSFFDVLDDAHDRGLDVRVVFWRTNPETDHLTAETFSGTPEDLDRLRRRTTRWSARWDRAHGAACHHQKSWVIDAEATSPIAFVGGMNLNPSTVTDREHDHPYSQHDVYAEIAGPAVLDVARNFAERWNHASDHQAADGRWGPDAGDELDPSVVPRDAGTAEVQLQRTMPGAGAHRPERSILEQYLVAIDAARESIVIQNQSMLAGDVLDAIGRALDRGVHVSFTLPAVAENHVVRTRSGERPPPVFATFAEVAAHPGAAVVGMVPRRPGARIHVHAKVMTIDDAWSSIGSCNLRDGSFRDYSELNVSIWDPALARGLRIELFDELTGADTAQLDLAAAHTLVAATADGNAQRLRTGETTAGLAVRIDSTTYGVLDHRR